MVIQEVIFATSVCGVDGAGGKFGRWTVLRQNQSTGRLWGPVGVELGRGSGSSGCGVGCAGGEAGEEGFL